MEVVKGVYREGGGYLSADFAPDPYPGSGFQNSGSTAWPKIEKFQNFFVICIPIKVDTRFLLEDHII